MARKMELGVVVKWEDEGEHVIRRVNKLGFRHCQISVYDPAYYTEAAAASLKKDCRTYGVNVDGLWAGWPGRVVWDFAEGPETIGLVPRNLRQERAQVLKAGSDFAKKLGIKRIITHLGFVPENMKDPLYKELIPVLQDIADHCRANGQDFLFETGQETPVTLLRTIEDIGLPNVGINLDPANLILYGKGNPVDALDVFGKYIKGVHIKDGSYPTDGRELGQEKPVGKGSVDFPVLLGKLRQLGYSGVLCIECELADRVWESEVQLAKEALYQWLAVL